MLEWESWAQAAASILSFLAWTEPERRIRRPVEAVSHSSAAALHLYGAVQDGPESKESRCSARIRAKLSGIKLKTNNREVHQYLSIPHRIHRKPVRSSRLA